MTHADIKRMFLIEYDKASVTSSYPSMTDAEMATVLDKAYLAWIAQKITGANPRRSQFQGDIKGISDIQPLIYREEDDLFPETNSTNAVRTSGTISEDCLYILPNAVVEAPINNNMIVMTTQLVSHEVASKFIYSDNNKPWIKHPVMYIESGVIYILYDPYRFNDENYPNTIYYSYIKKPQSFTGFDENTNFELGETQAQEIINQAVIMSAEIVESPRQQTKSNLIALES